MKTNVRNVQNWKSIQKRVIIWVGFYVVCLCMFTCMLFCPVPSSRAPKRSLTPGEGDFQLSVTSLPGFTRYYIDYVALLHPNPLLDSVAGGFLTPPGQLCQLPVKNKA